MVTLDVRQPTAQVEIVLDDAADIPYESTAFQPTVATVTFARGTGYWFGRYVGIEGWYRRQDGSLGRRRVRRIWSLEERGALAEAPALVREVRDAAERRMGLT